MSVTFFFDESFEGLLSAVFDAWTGRRFPDALLGHGARLPLLAGGTHHVVTERTKASRVFAGLRERLSDVALRDLMTAWLAEEAQASLPLFRYLCKTFSARRSLEHDLADPDAFAVTRLARRVRGECHRLEGFVRFQECSDATLFACIRPDCNVLPLLLPHFADRLAGERWALYDAGRRYGVLHDRGRLHDLFLDPGKAGYLAANSGRLPATHLSEQEAVCAALWRTYFDAAAVADRINPRLQRRCMPSRFWPYLTEKQPPCAAEAARAEKQISPTPR